MKNEIIKTAYKLIYFKNLLNSSSTKLFNDDYIKFFLNDDINIDIIKKIPNDKLNDIIDHINIRTKKIDNIILDLHNNIEQIVVFGAGFDTRPWRLKMNPLINWYDVDYENIINYKSSKLKENTICKYNSIIADLNDKNLFEILEYNGYSKNKNTLFILEGVINYLNVENIEQLFNNIYINSTQNSSIISTFMSSKCKIVNNLHLFRPIDPLNFMQKIKYDGDQNDLCTIGIKDFNKILSEDWNEYYILELKKK